MKNKTLTKKLSLNKKTVSNLEMAAVKGGYRVTVDTGCFTCVQTECVTCGILSFCTCLE